MSVINSHTCMRLFEPLSQTFIQQVQPTNILTELTAKGQTQTYVLPYVLPAATEMVGTTRFRESIYGRHTFLLAC